MIHHRLPFASVLLVVLAAAPPAPAAEWWRSWSGSCFPEAVGYFHGGQYDPAKRWLNDGMLWIDSREPYGRYSYYMIQPQEPFGPGPNEVFIMRWRLQVFQSGRYGDASVFVSSDEGYASGLWFEPDKLWVSSGRLYSLPITPGVFHDYEFRSKDMRQYDLYLDGAFLLHEVFYAAPPDPRFGWGDGSSGRGLSTWDSFEVGVKTLPPFERVSPGMLASNDRGIGLSPEPGPGASLAMLLSLMARRRL